MENRGINGLSTMRKSYKITGNIMEKCKFKIGDKVVVIKTEFTNEEWNGIGEVFINFSIGDEFIVKRLLVDKAIEIDFIDNNNYYYPVSGFELVDKLEPIFISTSEDCSYLIEIFNKLNIK